MSKSRAVVSKKEKQMIAPANCLEKVSRQQHRGYHSESNHLSELKRQSLESEKAKQVEYSEEDTTEEELHRERSSKLQRAKPPLQY